MVTRAVPVSMVVGTISQAASPVLMPSQPITEGLNRGAAIAPSCRSLTSLSSQSKADEVDEVSRFVRHLVGDRRLGDALSHAMRLK
jgi:hypothetical protein